MSEQGYYKSLKRILILKFILVSMTPLILIMAAAGYYFHTAYHQKVTAHLEELVKKHRQNIDTFLSERLADIRSMADVASVETLSSEEVLEDILVNLQISHGGAFVDLGLINAQGIQVAYAGPFKLGQADYSQAEWFNQAKNKNYYISDVFLGLRGLPHFIVAVRINEEGEDWILRSTIDFESFNFLVENIRIGATGQAFILNRNGEFQTSPRTDLSFEGPLIMEAIREHTGGRKYKSGEIIMFEGDGPAEGLIFLVTSMKGGDWYLVYQQNRRDAFSQLYQARILTFAVTLLGALAIVSMTIYLSRSMVNRIADADKAKDMMNEQVIEAGKLASVGELAAGIAHEINNPVAIMVEEAGWIEDLLREESSGACSEDEEINRALTQIRTQGARCKEITHKLLSFARKTDSRLQDININDLVEEVWSLCEQRGRFGNVKFTMALQPDLPRVQGSPTEVQQVLLNLINNAIDAMTPKGGLLSITTRSENDWVVVDVADTGGGIPKANLPRIFDPFFTTKPVGKGTGLGLSICYGIIKKMNGEISVNSAVGRGTTFHVKLPAVPEGGREQTPEGGTITTGSPAAPRKSR